MTRIVIVAGCGRSGSNKLLDILDRSSTVLCRNEPNGIVGGHFNGIGGELFPDDLTPERQKRLKHAVDHARTRRNWRDRTAPVEKAYDRRRWLADGRDWIMRKRKIRKTMGKLPVLKHAQEWTVSPLYMDMAALADSTLVLKLNSCPAWTLHLHDTNPKAHVIHNIRAPGGYLRSWYNRFIPYSTQAHFEREFASMQGIFDYFGQGSPERLRAFTTEDLIEIELWRWRYVNERLYQGLKGAERAILTTYASVDADPQSAARKIFDLAGEPFSDELRQRVGSTERTLFNKPHTHQLDDELIDRMVAKVLANSPLQDIDGLL